MAPPETFPNPPQFSDEDFSRCASTGDFIPLMFEWHKYVSRVAIWFTQIRRESPGLKDIDDDEYACVIGLTNRCARLMLAIRELSKDGLFGESTAILDRSLVESAVKLLWLCSSSHSDRFRRYAADGLRTELELEETIRRAVAKREGRVWAIERRMLASIDRAFVRVGVSREEVAEVKKLPDVASMLAELGHERLTYLSSFKMGSHHVHGTLISLHMHYLENSGEGRFVANDHSIPPQVNSFSLGCQIVLDALAGLLRFLIRSADLRDALEAALGEFQAEVSRLHRIASGSDFDVADEARDVEA